MTTGQPSLARHVPTQVAALCTVLAVLIAHMRINGQLGAGGAEAIFDTARKCAAEMGAYSFSVAEFLNSVDAVEAASRHVRPGLRALPPSTGA